MENKQGACLVMMPAQAALRASTRRFSSLVVPSGRGGSTLRKMCVQSGDSLASARHSHA